MRQIHPMSHSVMRCNTLLLRWWTRPWLRVASANAAPHTNGSGESGYTCLGTHQPAEASAPARLPGSSSNSSSASISHPSYTRPGSSVPSSHIPGHCAPPCSASHFSLHLSFPSFSFSLFLFPAQLSIPFLFFLSLSPSPHPRLLLGLPPLCLPPSFLTSISPSTPHSPLPLFPPPCTHNSQALRGALPLFIYFLQLSQPARQDFPGPGTQLPPHPPSMPPLNGWQRGFKQRHVK